MLLKELHIVLQKFTELCETNPDVHLLSFEDIYERLSKFNELNSGLVEIERNYQFVSTEEEINYYKKEKPEFQKFGMYYDMIYQIELERPPLAIKYYHKLLKRANRDFKTIKQYVIYYRSNSVEKDAEYFIRESKENHIFALVQANSMITKYLLDKTDTKTADDIIATSPKVKWNIGEHDILEMAKSFKGLGYAEGTLTDIAMSLGRLFGKEMKNIYQKSHFVTSRMNPGRFMERCANFLKKLSH